MRLVPKISLALAATAALSVACAAVGFQVFLAPRYEQLDREAAGKNGARVAGTFEDVQRRFADANRDWAHWDATYQFMADQSPAYVDENLKFTDLGNIDVDAIVFVDDARRIVFQRAHDPETQREETWFEQGKTFDLAEWRPFGTDDVFTDRTGVVILNGRPAIMSVSPILTSAKQGPARGELIFLRVLTAERIDELEDATQLVITPRTLAELPADLEDGSIALHTTDTDTHTYLRLTDPAGRVTLATETLTPRRFHEIGAAELRSIIVGVAITGLVLFFVGLMILSRFIARPLTHLSRHISEIAVTGVPVASGVRHGADEIGDVGRGFDKMIGSLVESRQLLEEQSYFGGMADLSASVLHNVRNALSPINTAVWAAGQALDEVRVDRLVDAARELQDPSCPPERRARLLDHVRAAATHAQEHKVLLDEALSRIDTYSAQISDILANYDDVGRGGRISEQVPVTLVIEEAARFARIAQSPPVDVEVTNTLPAGAAIMAQRIVLVQIAANIVANALDSIRRAGRERGVITVRAALSRRKGAPHVDICIGDNGEGIAPDDLARIFERTFSKRRSRPGGLGLFWCARAAATFDGVIIAERQAVGARFTISFPLAMPSASPSDDASVS